MAEKNRIAKDWDKIDREDDLLKEAQCDQMWKEYEDELATDEGVTRGIKGLHNSEYCTRNRKTRRKRRNIKDSRHEKLVKIAEKAISKDMKDAQNASKMSPKYKHHVNLLNNRKKNAIINP